MQVAPCNHQALCRLCFVHTIQEAVAARDLPLKCLLCGSKIIRVKNNSKSGGQEMISHPVHVGLGSRVKKIPKSVSGYSLCASSETEEQQLKNQRHPSLAQSQSSYSMSSGNYFKKDFSSSKIVSFKNLKIVLVYNTYTKTKGIFLRWVILYYLSRKHSNFLFHVYVPLFRNKRFPRLICIFYKTHYILISLHIQYSNVFGALSDPISDHH